MELEQLRAKLQDKRFERDQLERQVWALNMEIDLLHRELIIKEFEDNGRDSNDQ